MAYSLDLRKNALEYLKKGNSRNETSSIFGVTTQTLANWIQREKEGNLPAKQRISGSYKIDDELLKEFIRNTTEAYLYEISEHFKVTASAIFYTCKRIGITFKKRQPFTRKGTRKSERNLRNS